MNRSLPALGLMLGLLGLAAQPGLAAAPKLKQFLTRHCAECHDADVQKGGLRVDTLALPPAGADSLNLLVRLHDRVQAGEMPPKKSAQPATAERQAFLRALGEEIKAAESAASVGGRTLVRRMNRVEYEHALRDLLALPLLRVKELLPEDGQQFGFDKVAGALDISHIQMTKYLQAADAALRQAVVKAASRPETKVWREPAARQYSAHGAVLQKCGVPMNNRIVAEGLTSHIAGNPVADIGNSYRAPSFKGEAESFAVLTGVIGAHQPEGIQIDRFNPPVPGWYRVRFSLWSLRWERTGAELMRGLDITLREKPAATVLVLKATR